MAANPKYSDVAVNAEANALGALLNSGYLEIYAGAQPTNADTAIAGQANLATLTFAATAFGGAAAGVITANALGLMRPRMRPARQRGFGASRRGMSLVLGTSRRCGSMTGTLRPVRLI